MDFDDILQEFDAGNAPPSSAKDVETLTRAWIAERSAPEILPYHGDILERLMERIRQQIELVETETGNLDPTTNFRLILIQTELERVKYLVRSYLRARIHKIDKHSIYILSNPTARSRLSPSELSYLRSHLAIVNNAYLTSFLRNFPEGMRRLDDDYGAESMIEKPDMDGAVFCRVVKEPGEGEDTVRIEGTGAEIRLSKGDLYVVRYSAVRRYVERGIVELI